MIMLYNAKRNKFQSVFNKKRNRWTAVEKNLKVWNAEKCVLFY